MYPETADMRVVIYGRGNRIIVVSAEVLYTIKDDVVQIHSIRYSGKRLVRGIMEKVAPSTIKDMQQRLLVSRQSRDTGRSIIE